MSRVEELEARLEELQEKIAPARVPAPCWLCGHATADARLDPMGPVPLTKDGRGRVLCSECWDRKPLSNTPEQRGVEALAGALRISRGAGAKAATRFGLVARAAAALKVQAWCDTSAPPSAAPFAHVDPGTVARARELMHRYANPPPPEKGEIRQTGGDYWRKLRWDGERWILLSAWDGSGVEDTRRWNGQTWVRRDEE